MPIVPEGFADEELEQFVRGAPTLGAFDVAALREGTLARALTRTRGPEMVRALDLRVGDLTIRMYRPVDDPVPLVVYLHGGGWTSEVSRPMTVSAAGSRSARAARCCRSITGRPPSTPGRRRSTTPSPPCAGWRTLPPSSRDNRRSGGGRR